MLMLFLLLVRMGILPPPSVLPRLRTTPSPIVLASVVASQSSVLSSLAPPATVPSQPTVSNSAPVLPLSSSGLILPQAVTPPTLSETPVSTAVFMGDGMMPIPQKLINRILKLEFIEMQELLPENWPDFLSEDANKFYATFGKKKAPHVTNILTWVECYSALVSVLSSAYPQYVPEFMSYMSFIIKCNKQFEGLGWCKYDRAYRHHAAATKSLWLMLV